MDGLNFTEMGGGHIMEESAQEHLLLWVSLADSLDATFAAGEDRAVVDSRGSPPSFEDDGIRRGARFGEDTCVYYAVEGNFHRWEGTVTFWFKPDWDAQTAFQEDLGRILWDLRIEHGSVVPDDPSQRWALVYPNPGGKGRGTRSDHTFGCWRFCVATNRNRYLIGTRELRKDARTRQAVFGSQQHFHVGQWMHLAVTWTATMGRIWIDGQEDAQSALEEGLPDRPLPEHMQLGALPSWINAGACGVLADFRVYSRALTGEQIMCTMGS
jgi:hypothetical protein